MNNCRAAVFGRTVALFLILYQFRLLAGEIADTYVFIASLLTAFFASYIMALKKTKPLPAIISLLLVPAVVRLLIYIPRFFMVDNFDAIIQADTLLLNYDINTFVSIFPFYWFALSNFFCSYPIYDDTEKKDSFNRVLLRFFVIADCTILIIIFSIAKSSQITFYKLPVIKLAVFAFIILLQLFSLMLSLPAYFRPKKKEFAFSALLLLIITLIAGALLVRPMEENALSQGGGLLQPKIFDFDFAPFLKLESEISMNDDLIFIVRKNKEAKNQFDYDDHYLMRRYVLSAYNSGGEMESSVGFFRNDKIDELSQRAHIPQGAVRLNTPSFEAREKLNQEYYLVNIDNTAFIAMNEPSEIIPFEKWDSSSFKAVYSVNSMVSDVLPIELTKVVSGEWNNETLGLTEDEYNYYTEFGNKKNPTEREKRIKELSAEITKNRNNYFEKIEAAYWYLKYGDYKYSLKPGIAVDGDQLSHFLFNSKKGYCSYFAFAFASMLRSISIPCRVAVGFFLDPEEDKLGFFPVRSSMAHAWVEIWFPKYGWIEFDPTTKKLAEGEDFQLSQGIPSELFERLMKEILENHNQLKAKEAAAEPELMSESLQQKAAKVLRLVLLPLILILLIAVSVIIRFGNYYRSIINKDIRKKSIYLWMHVKLELSLAGYKKLVTESEGEYIERVSADFKCDTLSILFNIAMKARFSKEYTLELAGEFKNRYDDFSRQFKNNISLMCRILFIIFPLPILIFKNNLLNDKKKILGIFILTGILFSLTNDHVQTQENPVNPQLEADNLYADARKAQENEFWERAIELYNTGKKDFPIDPRFSYALGDLYFSRELYRLAMEEYLFTQNILDDDTTLLFKLAQTAGNLNENKLSAVYFEKLLAIDPDNSDAIGSLGWMYFKIHRLQDGEKLLLDAISRLGNDPDFCMTLATIYSDMFRYDDSKYYYLKAINYTKNIGYNSFTSIAYYNLSILESRFYRYNEAWQNVLNSLEEYDRASGHLARGELNLRQLNFKEAFNEYQISYEYDNSPLTKLNMAQALFVAGHLDEALAYSLDSFKSKHLYWMLNFGIDPVQYKRDLLEIIYKSYNGLAETEKLKSKYGFINFSKSFFTIVSYQFKYKINKILYKKYSLLSAKSIYDTISNNSGEEGQKIEALKYFYNSFSEYKRRAVFYLDAAKIIEVYLIPDSMPTYLYETGTLNGNDSILKDALVLFDNNWEKDMIADCYAEIAKIAKKRGKNFEADSFCSMLFSINPGAVRQNGLRLPVKLLIKSNLHGSKEKTIKTAIDKAGFKINESSDNRFSLYLTVGEDDIYCELYDGAQAKTVFRKYFDLKDNSKKDIYNFANKLADEFFIVN